MWTPHGNLARALAAVAAGSNEYSVRAYMIDSVPDSVNFELRLARCILQAYTQHLYHRVHIFTDCAEALRFFYSNST